MKHLYATAGAAALCLMAAPTQAAPVVNGGFQTGDFTGWTVSSDDNANARVEAGVTADYRASFAGSGVSSLSQLVTTDIGRRYRLTFDAALDFPFARAANAPAPGETRMLVTFNGAELEVQNATEAFSRYALEFTGGGPSSLLFQVGAGPGRWQLDNVAVEPQAVAAVPEPATWALMLLGFGMAGAGLRTRRRLVTFSAA